MAREGGNSPVYLTNLEVARRMVRGNTSDVEVPMSAREDRRHQQRAAAKAARKAKKAKKAKKAR